MTLPCLRSRTLAESDSQCTTRRISSRAAAVFEGLQRLLLGYRDVVDSDVGHARDLAACLQAVPVGIRPALLGSCVPAGHVHSQHAPIGAGVGPAIPARDTPVLRLHRTRRLDCDILRIPRYG